MGILLRCHHHYAILSMLSIFILTHGAESNAEADTADQCAYYLVNTTEVEAVDATCVVLEEGDEKCISLSPGQAMFLEPDKVCCRPSTVEAALPQAVAGVRCHKPIKCGTTNCKVTEEQLYCVAERNNDFSETTAVLQCPDPNIVGTVKNEVDTNKACSGLGENEERIINEKYVCCRSDSSTCSGRAVKCGGDENFCAAKPSQQFCVATIGESNSECAGESEGEGTKCSSLKMGEEMLIENGKVCCRPEKSPFTCEGKAVQCSEKKCQLTPEKQYCVQATMSSNAECMKTELKKEDHCSKLSPGKSAQYKDGNAFKWCCRPGLIDAEAETKCRMICGTTPCKVEFQWSHGYCVVSKDNPSVTTCPSEDKNQHQCKDLPIGSQIAVATKTESGAAITDVCCKPTANPGSCKGGIIQCGRNHECQSNTCFQENQEARCPKNNECKVLESKEAQEKHVGENKWCCTAAALLAEEEGPNRAVTKCPGKAVKCGEHSCSTTYCIRDKNGLYTCGNNSDPDCAKLGSNQLKIMKGSTPEDLKVCCVPNSNGECSEGKAYKCGDNFCPNTADNQYCIQAGQPNAECNTETNPNEDCKELGEGETIQFEEGKWCCRPNFSSDPTKCDTTALFCGNEPCSSPQTDSYGYCEADLEAGSRCPEGDPYQSCKNLTLGENIGLTIGKTDADVYQKHWCCKPQNYAGNCPTNLIQCGNDHMCKASSCILDGEDGQTRCPTVNEQVNGTCSGFDGTNLTEKRIGLKKWCCQPTASLKMFPPDATTTEQRAVTSCPKKAAMCGNDTYCVSTYCIQDAHGIHCDDDKKHVHCESLLEGKGTRVTEKVWCCKPGPGNEPVMACRNTSVYCGMPCSKSFCIGQGPPWALEVMLTTTPYETTEKSQSAENTSTAEPVTQALKTTTAKAEEESEESEDANKVFKADDSVKEVMGSSTTGTAATALTSEGTIIFNGTTSLATFAVMVNASTECPVDIKSYNNTCHLVSHEKRLARNLWCCKPKAEGNWMCPRRAVQCNGNLCDRPQGQSYCVQKSDGPAQCATEDDHDCSSLELGTEKRIGSNTWCCRPSGVGNTKTSCAMMKDKESQWCNNALCAEYTYCLRSGNHTSCPTEDTHRDMCNDVKGEKWVAPNEWCCKPTNEKGTCPGKAKKPEPKTGGNGGNQPSVGSQDQNPPAHSSSSQNTYSTKTNSIVLLLFIIISGLIGAQ